MRIRRFTAALGVAALLTAGCGSSDGTNADAPQAANQSNDSAGKEVDPNGTFKIVMGSDPGSVSPNLTTLGTARAVFAFGYDTLVSRTPDGKTVPRLAESWTTKADEVTYKLRDGITCTDGTKLTASDVAAEFDNIKDPKAPSPWRSLTVPMDYTATADDDARTVTIKTAEPFGLLTQGAGSLAIVCPKALKDPTAADHEFVGTGPYKVTEYVSGEHYILEKRDEYAWGPDGATTADMPKTVVISFVAEESTAANQLISGEVNAVQLPGPDQRRVEGMSDVVKRSVPVITGELDLNEAQGRVLSDKAVRVAIAASLDREKIAAVVNDGRGKVATNLIAEAPVTCPGDETTGTLPDFDLEAAKKSLSDAGWEPGADGIRTKDGKALELDAIYKSDATQPAIAMEYIAQQWENLGAKVNLQAVTNTAFSEKMYSTLDYDVAFSGLNIEMPFMLTPFHGGPTPADGGRNSGSTVNTEFDKLSAEALAADGDGCELWNKAHKALLSEVDVIPLAEGDRPFFVRGGTFDVVGLHSVPTSYRVYK